MVEHQPSKLNTWVRFPSPAFCIKLLKAVPKKLLANITVGVAKLVIAPDCGSGGRGFESHHPPSVLEYNGL